MIGVDCEQIAHLSYPDQEKLGIRTILDHLAGYQRG
jgi:hypothetical protein